MTLVFDVLVSKLYPFPRNFMSLLLTMPVLVSVRQEQTALKSQVWQGALISVVTQGPEPAELIYNTCVQGYQGKRKEIY